MRWPQDGKNTIFVTIEQGKAIMMIRKGLLPLAIAFILFANQQTLAQSGIQFFEGTWSEALSEAKMSGKYIFVDVYTDWCPPCKQMDKEVLSLPEVGQRYNTAFVNYKLNAEEGPGIALAEQYAARAYPTYLYLDAEGNLLHRAVGFLAPSAFIAQADQALAAAGEDEALGRMKATFEDGQRDREFLERYIRKLRELGLDNHVAVNAYFSGLSPDELQHPETLRFLAEQVNSIETKAVVFLLANYDRLDESTKTELAPRLFSLLRRAAGDAIETDPVAAKQLFNYARQLLPYVDTKHERAYLSYYLHYCTAIRDAEGVRAISRRLTEGLMDIPLDSIRAEDDRRYREIMEPFWSGVQDSTKIEGFEEEKKFLRNMRSREVGSLLYAAVEACVEALPTQDPTLREALDWATRCDELLPGNSSLEALLVRIRERLSE